MCKMFGIFYNTIFKWNLSYSLQTMNNFTKWSDTFCAFQINFILYNIKFSQSYFIILWFNIVFNLNVLHYVDLLNIAQAIIMTITKTKNIAPHVTVVFVLVCVCVCEGSATETVDDTVILGSNSLGPHINRVSCGDGLI